jgi:hypothetical protein
MSELFDTHYFRGQGPILIGGRTAAGAPDGLLFVGDMGEVTLEPNVDYTEVIENVTGQGGIGSSSLKRAQFDLKIMMRSIKPVHLAAALQGVATPIAGGSVTNQAHTARQNKFVRLGHVNVSAVTVTGTGGTPTHVAGTDYIVHADKGLIEILAAGITDGASIEVDYTYAAQTTVTTNPGNTDKYVVFSGKNTANNGKQTRCEIYKVRFDPGALSLITEEESEYTISGRVLLDSLRSPGDQFFKWTIED